MQFTRDLVAGFLQQFFVGHVLDCPAGILTTGYNFQKPGLFGTIASAFIGVEAGVDGIAKLADQDHRIILGIIQQHAHRVAALKVDSGDGVAHPAVKAPILERGPHNAK